jgi:hypothetical protein
VQEALLGMTALFRGEYDPIEKFGVAMKQSEINAELAARGQDKLEGAARRNAEQTIRLELLYQRAADATGAFTAQSGNLYVEQKKLQAQFENLQATVGTQLLPVMGELVAALKPLVDELTPRLTQAVTDSLPALEVFIQFIKDTGDATTTTGQTMGFLADSVGATFKFISSNFGVLVQFALLLGTVTTALRLFAIASAFVVANPITAALLLAGGAFIFGADAARRLTDDTNLAGASLKAFNGIGNETAKTGVYMGGKFGRLAVDFADTSDEAKRLQTEVANADRARLENLKAQVNGVRISAAYAANELRRMSMMAGVKPSQSGAAADVSTTVTTGGKPAAAALSAVEQLNKTQTLSVKQAEAQGKLLGVGLEQGVVNQILAMSKPVKSANDIFKSLTKKNGELSKKGIAKVKEYNDTFNAGIEQVNQRAAEAASAAAAAAQEAQRQADELRRAEEARIEGLNQLYANFLETIKGTFAGIRTAIQGAFDITGLGGSTNAIIRNMNKLLAKMKSFSANVKSLATMGLDPALLQQVIQAGPVAGSRLAAALVAGGAGALGDINAGFMQASSLASEIATTGVNSLFDTKAQQNQYNITVTGGVGSGATIGKAIVDAIKDYERTSGAVWQGA